MYNLAEAGLCTLSKVPVSNSRHLYSRVSAFECAAVALSLKEVTDVRCSQAAAGPDFVGQP